MTAANFARLDVARPEVSRLVAAMLQARQAVVQRSWSHPQQESPDDWWADVLADPRARRQTRGSHSRGALNIYRLRDEPRATILVACTSAIGRRRTAATNSLPCTVPIAQCLTCSTTLPLLVALSPHSPDDALI